MDNSYQSVSEMRYRQNNIKFTRRWSRIKQDFKVNKVVYLMALPIILYYLTFKYLPMYGEIIAFKDYNIAKGILGSRWVGFQQFENFFTSYYFFRLLRNTLLINLYQLIFGFWPPIILALLLNEVRNKYFKKSVQTITYIPHFISLIVICGMIVDFTSTDGLVNSILSNFGIKPVNWLLKPEFFRGIYVGSDIWKGMGWSSIIYIAALNSIDEQLYESVKIDGGGRWKQLLNVTLPGIMPTIVILLILQIGRMMGEGFGKVILLYSPATYETADIISSFVYRKGLLESKYSFSTAVGLFNSVVNITLLVFANKFSKKVSETSLW